MKKKHPGAGAPMSIRLAEDLKRDLETAARKLRMDTHQVMRTAMEIGLQHFAHIDYNLAKAVLDQSIAAQTSRVQKTSEQKDLATSQIALLNEDTTPTNIESLPPRQDVSYGSSKKKPRKRNGTED